MGDWARVRLEDDIVTEVIGADRGFIDRLGVDESCEWIECDYYTRHNTHANGGTPLRGNFPSTGFMYIRENDVFIEPKPYDSWTLNTNNWTWQAPVTYPDDGKFYFWEEFSQQWVENPYLSVPPLGSEN